MVIMETIGDEIFNVMCCDCNSSGPDSETESGAYLMWNVRSTPKQQSRNSTRH